MPEPIQIEPDFEVCEQGFIRQIANLRLQKYFTVREYRVRSSDLTSLLGKY